MPGRVRASDGEKGGVNILFVYYRRSSFVRTDLALLRERYSVTEFHQPSRAINVFRVWQAVRNHDFVFCWFASWHSFFPVLFARLTKKPSIVVTGGYDLAPSLGIEYGHQTGGFRKWVTNTTLHLATHLLALAQHSKVIATTQVGVDPTRITTAYLGLDATPYAIGQDKVPCAITVGDVDRSTMWRKGILPFVRAAALLSDVPFVVIGDWKDDAIDLLRTEATPNVRFTGWVSDEELGDWYRRASAYVQASLHEGFGLAVAEAMLCGCIPVVTRAGALAEVVGDTGLHLLSQEPRAIADGVHQALAFDGRYRARARERIVNEFPLSRRADALYKVIDTCVTDSKRDRS
jgi:glycosyltransferase involved in cell wall biosynthesis